MSLVVSSLSYERAPLEIRERFACSTERQMLLLQWLKQQNGVNGAVLLFTCNRTELYLTGEAGTPCSLLCRGLGIDNGGSADLFLTLTGEDAARHLMEVTCGLHSQIRGEDQILSQVRKAMDFAREQGTLDSELATLFRLSVTVGKQVRTQIPVSHAAPSVGLRTVEILNQSLSGLSGKKVLVIGNGQMGRLAAELLQQASAEVTITLRSYRHRETVVPAGCSTVPYEDRMSLLGELDAIVSATTSPHYTIQKTQLDGLTHHLILVDLAVPRDVDPACEELDTVTCFSMDSLGTESVDSDLQVKAEELIDAQMDEFHRWKLHQSLPETPFRFPLFIDLTEKQVVLFGGGKIAARRIGTLRLFGCNLIVIAPDLQAQPGTYTWIQRNYQSGDLDGAYLAIAATDSRSVNHQIAEDAKVLGIPVSVADCEAESTFYFPAICTGEKVIAGVVSHGKDHHATARAAKEIRKVLEELS